MDELYSTEFHIRHARNVRALKWILRQLRRPPIFVFALVLLVMGYGELTNDDRAGIAFLVLCGIILIGTPLYLIWLTGRGIRKGYDAYRGSKAVCVPKGHDNSASMSWIVQNHKLVLEGCGLTERDNAASAKASATAAAAGLYGRGRTVRVAQAASLAGDRFLNRRVPALKDVRLVDSTRSELAFEMLPGQTIDLWDSASTALAAGFHVPRVAVDQPEMFLPHGMIRLSIFHADPLAGVEEFEVVLP